MSEKGRLNVKKGRQAKIVRKKSKKARAGGSKSQETEESNFVSPYHVKLCTRTGCGFCASHCSGQMTE